MRKLILVLFSSICLVSAAQQADVSEKLRQIYSEYSSQKDSLFKSKFNRKNAAKKVQDFMQLANDSLRKIQDEEKENGDLSSEGTQVALDLELIVPIQNLVNSKYSSEDCDQANHLNNLNNQNDDTERSRIELIIKSLCKN